MQNTDYLRFPLDTFWVSGSDIVNKTITIGTFKSDEESTRVKSLGRGTVVGSDTESMEIEYADNKGVYRVKLVGLTPTQPLNKSLELGEEIGVLREAHLEISVRMSRGGKYFRKVDPIKHVFLHRNSINYKNVPYCTPRLKPNKPFDERR